MISDMLFFRMAGVFDIDLETEDGSDTEVSNDWITHRRDVTKTSSDL